MLDELPVLIVILVDRLAVTDPVLGPVAADRNHLPVFRRVEHAKHSLVRRAVGDLTLHGVTKELTADFEATYILASKATAKRAPGDLVMVKASFKIALKDYDISGVRGLVGSKVGKTIDVDVSLFGSTALADDGK